MSDPTEIQLDVGGTLTFDPPQLYRPEAQPPDAPDAATVTLYTPGGAVHVATQDATVDPVNVALALEAAEGDTSLSLADATGVVPGRRYILGPTTGPPTAQWVKVTSVDLATHVVQIAEPLPRGAAAGDSLASNRLTVAVSAAQAATLAEGYEARWTYTWLGLYTWQTATMWDVTRSVWSDVLAAPWEFRDYALALGARNLQLASGEGLDFADELERATSQVRADIRERQLRPGLFRAPAGFKSAIYERVLLGWAESGINIPNAWQQNVEGYLIVRRERYAATLAQALSTTPYDADESGTVTDRERTSRLGSIRIRL